MTDSSSEDYQVTNRILTVPNVISCIRLLLVPVYLLFLYNGQNVAALVVFIVAAASDFVDGQVARRTNQVSKLGKVLDPAIDTILMFTGIIGVVFVGRLPAWFAVYVLVRESFLLVAGAILISKYDIHVPVVYPGKFATTFLFAGFAGMFLGAPEAMGLGITSLPWFPGFSPGVYVVWVWLIYAGIILQVGVTVYYCWKAWTLLQAKKTGGAKDIS